VEHLSRVHTLDLLRLLLLAVSGPHMLHDHSDFCWFLGCFRFGVDRKGSVYLQRLNGKMMGQNENVLPAYTTIVRMGLTANRTKDCNPRATQDT